MLLFELILCHIEQGIKLSSPHRCAETWGSGLLLHRGQMAAAYLRMITAAVGVPRSRRKQAFSSREMNALLANMEHMVRKHWCSVSVGTWGTVDIWDHSPSQAMKYMGQNLSVTSGRFQSITDLVRSWYDEKHHFSYPERCSGPVCSHYTQMVWASTNRVGCALRKCSNMYVHGSTWREATLLVCNYSIKGNWVGEAPYKTGNVRKRRAYGGSCWRNQCTANAKTRRLTRY
uniref:SCP domain-containing protein n=1 Tax=Monopterus albus TaxID=43700 RepID=A0A3Q3J5A6_MONAL